MHQADAVRIIIADDHPIFRKGLKSLLDAEPGFQVVGEAENGDEAVQLARALRPDILLLDLAMPNLSGMDALRELASESAPIPVRTILLTAGIQRAEIVQRPAARCGRRRAEDRSPRTCCSRASGPSWQASTGSAVTACPTSCRPCGATPKPPRPRGSASVSPRASWRSPPRWSRGFSNKEIAKKFVLSEDTVKHHLTNIFDKVGASNRLELALFAVHHRLLEERDSIGM